MRSRAALRSSTSCSRPRARPPRPRPWIVDGAGRPDTARAGAITRHCVEHGRVLFMTAGSFGNVVRWIPPLIATDEQLAVGVEAFAAALSATG